MRKIFSFMVATVDGYYEGPNQEFDWPIVDEEFNKFAIEQLDEVDTLLFGRVTYQGMAAYWPTPAAEQDDPKVAAEDQTLQLRQRPALLPARCSLVRPPKRSPRRSRCSHRSARERQDYDQDGPHGRR